MKNKFVPCLISLTGIISLSSCALDPEYREWKEQQRANTANSNPYGAPAASNNPYGTPQSGGEAGNYTPSGSAPYQPIPGVNQSATPSTTSTPSASGGSHTVVSGDTLWGLARKYGTTVEAIQAANGLTTTDIRKGSSLVIPGQ